MAEEQYTDFESDVDYNTVLDDFEGPLDLLLHLINIAQIKIEDVFVSQVTEQFLDYIDYMKTQPSRDVDKESEYLALAAQIIYIKSKSLLPVIEYEDEVYAEIDTERQELIEQLKQREYELIKQETPKLKEMETTGFFYKQPEKEFTKPKVVYRDFTVDGLLKAFAQLMMKNEGMRRERDDVKEIPKDIYTVPEKLQYIKAEIIEKREISFDSLFDTYSKNEVITTFQALLEMLKYQYIRVEQNDEFGDITIKINPDWDMKDVNEEIDEYD